MEPAPSPGTRLTIISPADGPLPHFDLQSHSEVSDGELTPTGVVRAAARAGVDLLALTDHDSVDGVVEARTAAEDAGIVVVPAVEISVLDPAGADLHLLGYLVDTDNGALLDELERSRADRATRAGRMVDRLEDLGWAVDREMLDVRAGAGRSVGRPHIAEAAFTHPANAARLRRQHLADPTAFLVANLIEGTPGFVARNAPTVAEAIRLIHEAGGVAVWAHPFWDIEADPAVLATLTRFRELGLDGVEAFYATHTREQTELLARRAAALGLLTTGSTDFHGPHHRQFNRFRGFRTYGLEPNLGPIATPDR